MEESTEESRVIILAHQNSFDRSREFLQKSVDEQRFLFYENRITDFHLYKVIETDTHIYWSEDKFKPKFNKSLFYITTGISGISFDKKTRDLKFWFGKTPHPFIIESFLGRMNTGWWCELPRSFQEYFTLSLAKAVAKNKINTIEDYATHLCKRSLIFKNVDPKSLCKMIYVLKAQTDIFHVSLSYVGSALSVAKDKDDCIEYLISKNHYYHTEDAIRYAQALDLKIDFTNLNDEAERLRKIYYVTKQLYCPDDAVLPF